jgi:hypothetical protein
MWVLSNFYKDKQESFEETKLLCRFINPEAAKHAFDQIDEISEMDDAAFLEEINAHTKTPLTAEELEQRIQDANNGNPDLDIIEVVEK